MTKLEEIKCPNCGAKLIKIESEYFSPTYHCDYCGTDFNTCGVNLREIRPQTVKVLSAKLKIPEERLFYLDLHSDLEYEIKKELSQQLLSQIMYNLTINKSVNIADCSVTYTPNIRVVKDGIKI